MALPLTAASLKSLLADIGFLPLFRSSVPGFSVEDMVPNAPWYTGEENDPWSMREPLASDPDIVYGKLFANKSGFCHASCYGRLLNLRRDGYDFDTRVEEGVISSRERAVMNALARSDRPLFAFELRREAGFGKEGFSGFEQTIASLQHRCYLLVHGFARKRDRFGKEYGWNVNVYDTPERRFGADFIERAYAEDPSDSLDALLSLSLAAFPSLDPSALRTLISGER